jgi:hypothetical protein
MKLSEINPTPLYDVTIPSTQKRVKYRPFFVKEERALLAAYESEDVNVMLNTLTMVVKNCLNETVNSLTSFDIEYLFIQIRAKSVGEFTTLNFTCPACEKVTPMSVDIRAAEVTGLNKNPIVVLSDNLSVKMKYPSIEDLLSLEKNENSSDVVQTILTSCMETIFIDSEALNVEEESGTELMAFTERLSSKQYKQLEEFILSTPTVELGINWVCPGCKNKNETLLTGLTSFF